MNDAPQATTPSGRARWLPLALGLAVLGALWLWLLLGSEVQQAIRKLYADDPRTQEEGRRLLRAHGDREEVNQALEATVRSPAEAYSVRRQCAALLEELGQLPRLEAILRDADPVVRFPVLGALSQKSWFVQTIVGNSAFDVPGTVRTWLAREGDTQRSDAIALARQLDDATLMPLIRPLLRRSGDPRIHADTERMLIESALAAVGQFKDCESLPAAVELAQHDADARVRMRALQAVHRVAFLDGACPGAVADEVMENILTTALDAEDGLLRQAAGLELAKQPRWAARVRTRLQARLDDPAEKEVVRRAALEALAAVRDQAFIDDLPRWFHEPTTSLRSAAVQATTSWKAAENPFLGALIGLLRTERESRFIWDQARKLLRDVSGADVGVEETLRAQEGLDRKRFERFLTDLFDKGEGEGVQRVAYARRWFNWYVQRLGLESELRAAAMTAYDRFWDRAEANDVAGARTALASLPEAIEKAFGHERAWLATR